MALGGRYGDRLFPCGLERGGTPIRVRFRALRVRSCASAPEVSDPPASLCSARIIQLLHRKRTIFAPIRAGSANSRDLGREPCGGKIRRSTANHVASPADDAMDEHSRELSPRDWPSGGPCVGSFRFYAE